MSGPPTLICPLPLLTFSGQDYVNTYETTVKYASPGLPCVIPCPSLVYNADEWDTLQNVLFAGSLCALIASLIAFLSHLTEFYKYYIRVMFIGGFLVSSLVVFFFAVMNRKNEIVCADDNSAFIEKGPVCLFQACASIFVFTWIELWACILAFDSYLMVHNRQISLYSTPASHDENKRRLYKIYTAIALVVCTVLTLIPLIAGNYGFDPEANVPICLFLFSRTQVYFWTVFYLPFTLLVSGCVYFSIRGIMQIQAIFVNSPRYFDQQQHGGGSERSSQFSKDRDRDRDSRHDRDQNNPILSLAEDSNDHEDGGGGGGGGYLHSRKLVRAKDSLLNLNEYDEEEEEEEDEREKEEEKALAGQAARYRGLGQGLGLGLGLEQEGGDSEQPLLRNSHVSSGSGGGIRLEQFAAGTSSRYYRDNGNTASASASANAGYEPPVPTARRPSGGGGREGDEQEEGEGDVDAEAEEAAAAFSADNVFALSPNTSASNSKHYSEHLLPELTYGQSSSSSGYNNKNAAPAPHFRQWNQGGLTNYSEEHLDASYMVGIGADDSSSDRNYSARKELTAVLRQDRDRDGNGNGNGGTTGNTVGLGNGVKEKGLAAALSDDRFDATAPFGTIMPLPLPLPLSLPPPRTSSPSPNAKARTVSRGRTESSQSNETISLGTDVGSDDSNGRTRSRVESQSTDSIMRAGAGGAGAAAGGSSGGAGASPSGKKRSKSKKKSLIKSTRDRILGMLTENEMVAQTLKYNGRAIIFVVIFCLTTMYIIPLLADLQYFKYKKYQDGSATFVSCLLTASAQSQADLVPQNVDDVSNYVAEICGDMPTVRPSLGLIISAICWYAAYGIIPALVFGAGSYMIDCCCINDALSINPEEVSHNSNSNANSNANANRPRTSTA